MKDVMQAAIEFYTRECEDDGGIPVQPSLSDSDEEGGVVALRWPSTDEDGNETLYTRRYRYDLSDDGKRWAFERIEGNAGGRSEG